MANTITGINYTEQDSASDYKDYILKQIPKNTVLYISTHGDETGFGDSGDTAGYENPEFFLKFDSHDYYVADHTTVTDPSQTVAEAVSLKPSLGQPPYNFVQIDACHGAGDISIQDISTSGCAAFGITGQSQNIDRAFLGWQNTIWGTCNVDWTEQVWGNLANGYTLLAACQLSTANNIPVGSKGESGIDVVTPVPISPVIIGDPRMTLHGVYGTGGTSVYYTTLPGVPTISLDFAHRWFKPL